MDRKNPATSLWRSAIAGAVLCAVVGLALSHPPGDWLAHVSYDLAVMWRPRAVPPEVVLVYMDEKAFRDLKQDPKNWDRALHADLLDWLTREQAKLVVLDVTLTDLGSPTSNEKLVRALRAHGHVVLAAWFGRQENPSIAIRTVERPLPEFESAAAGWGLSELEAEGAAVVRQFFQGDEREPSLPWVAAAMAGADVTRAGAEQDATRWLNYYGPPGTLRNVSFSEATNQPPGYFKDQCVFIGSWRTAYYAHDRTDEFSTPHTGWSHKKMSGVEIVATAFLNLLRDEWWTRLEPWQEQLMVGIAGLLFGFGLCFVRPGVACGLAGVSMLLIAWLGITLTWQTRVWSAWTIPVGAQLPLAVAWSWLAYAKRLRREKETLRAALTKTAEQLARVTPATGSAPPAIPDFSLLKRVGEGGYGEVWLARNAVGMFQAVKLVRRAAFASEEPYEREFRGIQHFMPISRSHPGLVHVLHVGRNEDAGFFFCAMEASDDEVSGRQIDANSYSPRTLAKDLARHGPLPVEECARLGAALAAALEHLHQRRLIHRDLKPANIIYVEGEPKLADIGLVTGMGGPADSVSRVGTEGFVAPEGPGTAAADIYSLGKVLYEAGMGADRRRFPELPTAIYDAADHPRRMQLNEIIVKACATKAEERYRSAEELRADLEKLVDVMRDA